MHGRMDMTPIVPPTNDELADQISAQCSGQDTELCRLIHEAAKRLRKRPPEPLPAQKMGEKQRVQVEGDAYLRVARSEVMAGIRTHCFDRAIAHIIDARMALDQAMRRFTRGAELEASEDLPF